MAALKKEGSKGTKQAKGSKKGSKEQSAASSSAPTGSGTVNDYALLREPVVTEKSSQLGEGGSTVVFIVPRTSTKLCVKQAVERVFGVSVLDVRTLNLMGKPKRTRGALGRRVAVKKAYVTLKPGQRIDLIEGV